MLIDAGPRDQRPVQALPDYGLTYCGEALSEDLTIAGEVRVTLSVQSNCRDTDFVAKLTDLHPDGSAMLLIDGAIRAMYCHPSGEPHHLAPDRVERVTINLGHICHTFGAGHRIELDVTSSNFRAAPATLTAAIRYWRMTATPTSASPATPFTTPS